MEPDVDAFLEHYGKKGMKWGVVTSAASSASSSVGSAVNAKRDSMKARSEVRGLRKAEVKKLTKASDDYVNQKTKERYTRTKSNGKTGLKYGKIAADGLSGQMLVKNRLDVVNSVGYKGGKAAAIVMLGGQNGTMLARDLKISKEAKAKYAYAK